MLPIEAKPVPEAVESLLSPWKGVRGDAIVRDVDERVVAVHRCSTGIAVVLLRVVDRDAERRR